MTNALSQAPAPPSLPLSLSQELSIWARAMCFEDLPAEVIRDTRLRVLDVIGLALAG